MQFAMKSIVHLRSLISVAILFLLFEGVMSNPLASTSEDLQQTHSTTEAIDLFSHSDIIENLGVRSGDKAKKPAKKPNADCLAVKPNLVTIEVPPPSFANASWIWTNEVQPPTAGGTVPAGARPFLKVLHTNCPINHVMIDIGCDNFYTLYVNGKLVGSGKNMFSIVSTQLVTVAIYVEQDPATLGSIGLLTASIAWNSKVAVPREIRFVTDVTWKTFPANDFDRKFIQNFFDASRWKNALVLGHYGVAPWGDVVELTSPTAQNPGLTGIQGIPDAPQAQPATVVTLGGKFQ
ncbi:hypothetical protein CPB84DRAFT_1826440 [Gymnopilus junonius]|uniref:Uncharacterized protein n=1 Tax=Gymnopilus junonius TaxID=109634 RepID=A0A9P5TK05_GYMJU|nr:hypothetical protein CPB84DRAFT_1826440 [Gymnopilus junonius]